jgi:glycine C-acetyltransferase
MNSAFSSHLAAQLDAIRAAGTYKRERVLSTPQGSTVSANGGGSVLNMCANNYLGLAQHPAVKQAAHDALEKWGYGLASVRFICGTQGVHKELEASLTDFLGTEDTILYGSCFDANGGLFETILGPEEAIISDELNHASIIDGVRLCKAQRYRYKNCDMADLEDGGCERRALQAHRHRRRVLDGRLHRAAEGDLRSCGQIQRARDGR